MPVQNGKYAVDATKITTFLNTCGDVIIIYPDRSLAHYCDRFFHSETFTFSNVKYYIIKDGRLNEFLGIQLYY